MKNLLTLIFSSILLFTSCKNEKKVNEDTIEIEAEFIYIQDAAVLKGQSFIYGVVLDDKAKELAEKVSPMKKDQYDMVPVVINGLIKPNPKKDGWKEVVEIKEILKVSPVKEQDNSNTINVNVN